jgi:hypothetical protein
MNHDRNPKEAVDDPEPIVDRDPNDGLIITTPEWIEWHLAKALTSAETEELRERLTHYGDEAGLEELNYLVEPTRFDFNRLSHVAVTKYATRSDVSGLEY